MNNKEDLCYTTGTKITPNRCNCKYNMFKVKQMDPDAMEESGANFKSYFISMVTGTRRSFKMSDLRTNLNKQASSSDNVRLINVVQSKPLKQ